MEYDENFLVVAADRFEQQARTIQSSITARFTVFALIGTFALARGLEYIVAREMVEPLTIPSAYIVGIGTAAAAGIGWLIGRARAFQLRVEAHKLLALVEIHRSTGKPADPRSPLESVNQLHA
jgi:hypothetical protein